MADNSDSIVVSAKISKVKRQQLEQMRKALRLRSIGDVIRMSFDLMQQAMELHKMVPATMDEQKALFDAMSKIIDEVPDDLTPEANMREVIKRGREYIEDRTDTA